ncbi:MAG: CPBP family intramembrane metalloprotease [Chloroflexota bacterium]|nr:CPBP family intramembrane metalloprotease [Chloroflexota bacterium]
MAQRKFNWKVFLALWLGTLLGVTAIVPYSLALQAPVLEKTKLPLPLEVLIPIQIAQNALIFAVAVAAGMFFAYRIGLGAPIMEAFFARDPSVSLRIRDRVKAILVPSIALGVVASLAIIGLDAFVFAPEMKAELGALATRAQSANPPAWQGLLASFYGGIDEEVLMRLLLLSLLAWLGKFVSHTAKGRPTLVVLWVANILVAVIFGLGHLPATALLLPLTPLVIVRAIVLNGLAGLAFGYLYWKHGIESAMLSHFSADIVLHVLFAI